MRVQADPPGVSPVADPAAPDAAPEHGQGPLSSSELQQLEATLLPALERHHLRLLAHALRTLQEVQQVQRHTGEPQIPQQIPSQAAIEEWLLAQPALRDATDFGRQLAAQLRSAGRQLEALGQQRGVAPLELDLDALIDWARRQADQRLATEPPARLQTPPTAPPADR